MKKQFILFFFMLSLFSFGQRSGIGTISPEVSSAYEIKSTTGGFLPPRMTQTQRDAIATPAAGLLIFNTDSNCQEFFNGTKWFNLCNGGSSITITNQPIAPAPTCPGDGTQTLSVTATGSTTLSYSWRKDGIALTNVGAVSGQGSATLTLTNPQVSDAGNYEVVVSDGTSAVVSYNVPVVVYDTSIAYVSGEQTTLSTSYTLSAYAPGSTINWYATSVGGTVLATGTQFTLPTSSSTITYYVDATVAGCTTPTRTPVTVSAPLVIGAAGKTWMTYNLGATDIAKSYKDYTQYGSLYQWGRGSDGHELINWTSATSGSSTNGMTNILSTTNSPGHSNFIYDPSSLDGDWRNPQNDALWQGINGINNPCPNGYRVPTATELQAEFTAANIKDIISGYNSSLKLVAPGYRNNAGIYDSGKVGYYWTSTISSKKAIIINLDDFFLIKTSSDRKYGQSIRCIKD